MTKKLLSMLLAIVMVFGFATPAMAEQIEEPGFYAPAGSVQPLGSSFGIWLYVTAPECDCGTDCGASVRVTGGIKSTKFVGWDLVVEPYNEVLTAGSKTLQVYFNSSNPVTVEAVCGSCQYDFTEWEIAEDRLLGGNKVTTASESKLVIDEKSFLIPTYYTAKFQTEKTYTVKYVDGVSGAAFADQSYTVKYNEATPAFSGTPTREGYNFLGWEPRVAEKVTADVTYTAQWEEKEFTVKYVDGVSGAAFADQSYTVKYNDLTPAFEGTPTRTGYNFLGWEPRVAEKVTADATYTARWEAKEFTVTYKDPYNSFKEQVYTVKYGDKVPAFQGTPEREGYVFSTWNKKYKEVTGPTSETVTQDRTFSARWTALPNDLDAATAKSKVQLRVTDVLRQNGGFDLRTVKLIDGTYTIGESKWSAEKQAVLSTVVINKADFEKYGKPLADLGYIYHFNSLGTYTDTDSNGNLVIHLKNKMGYQGTANSSNLAAYFGGWLLDTDYYPGSARAQLLFDRYYKVTYTDGVSGEEVFADQVKEAKENDPTPAFSGTPTRTDYAFLCWEPRVAEKVTADATYTAQWKLIAFNVSFNSNGGNTLDPIKVTLNKPYGTLPSAGSINGLQNLGWYLVDEQGNVTDTAVNAKTVVTLERDHTLFQKREIKTPTVKISLSRPVYNYLDKPVSLNASLTEYPALKYSYQWYKDGAALANGDLYDGVNTKSLTLKHDYVSASGVYKLVVTVTLADGSDIVVTNSPVTAEASYTLNIRRTSNMLYYDANGGEGGPSNNSDYYDKANDRYVAKVQSSQPTRSEWKFIGWNTKADGSGDSYKAGDFYVFDRQLSENGGLKAWLYAQWDHLTCSEHLEDVKVITAPTCTEKGLKLCRCTVCGDEYEVEIPALGHDHGGRWTWNREEHWKKCLRCGAIIDCEEHTYGDWKPVVDNKGKDTDREERSCTVCGFTQYAQIIHIGGSTVTKPTGEQNPNTGAQVPSLLPALAVLAGAAVVLRKRK